MATGSQVVAALDDKLQLSGQGARYWRDRLAGARLIRASQGKRVDTPLTDVATILLAVLIGSRAAAQPGLAVDYGSLMSSNGDTLQAALAAFLADPANLLRLAVDNASPAAAIVHRDDSGNVVESTFLPETVGPREGFARLSHVDGNTFTGLALAIANAPTPQPRRRVRRKRN